MAQFFEERLKQKGNILPRSATAESSDLSQRLGKVLAMAAPASEGCDDKKTFELRMRNLQSVIQKRRDAAKASTQQQKSRRQRLIEVVGTQRAQCIVALVREIRVLRLRRKDLGTAAFEAQMPLACGRGGCSANVYSLKSDSPYGKMPQEVRDLFFNTAIVDAVEKASLSNFGKLPWNQLYAQGKQRVQAYRTWLQKHQGATQKSP